MIVRAGRGLLFDGQGLIPACSPRRDPCCGPPPPPPGGCCDWGFQPLDCDPGVLGPCVECGDEYTMELRVSFFWQVVVTGFEHIFWDSEFSPLYNGTPGGFFTMLGREGEARYRVRAACGPNLARIWTIEEASMSLTTFTWANRLTEGDPLRIDDTRSEANTERMRTAFASIFGTSLPCPQTTANALLYGTIAANTLFRLGAPLYTQQEVGQNSYTLRELGFPFGPSCSGSLENQGFPADAEFAFRFPVEQGTPFPQDSEVYFRRPELQTWTGTQNNDSASYSHQLTRPLYAPPQSGGWPPGIVATEYQQIESGLTLVRETPCAESPCPSALNGSGLP